MYFWNFFILAALYCSMEIKIVDSYNLFFHDKYVIVEAHEDAVIDSKVTGKTIKQLLEYYENRPFTLISHRRNNYSIKPDAYSPRVFRKIPRIAVVSTNPGVKERAIVEQMQFENSFAFFEELDEAVSWAKSHRELGEI